MQAFIPVRVHCTILYITNTHRTTHDNLVEKRSQQHTLFCCHFSWEIYCAKLLLNSNYKCVALCVCMYVYMYVSECALLFSFMILCCCLMVFSLYLLFLGLLTIRMRTCVKSFHFSLIVIYGNNCDLNHLSPSSLVFSRRRKNETSCIDAGDIDLENEIHSPDPWVIHL